MLFVYLFSVIGGGYVGYLPLNIYVLNQHPAEKKIKYKNRCIKSVPRIKNLAYVFWLIFDQ